MDQKLLKQIENGLLISIQDNITTLRWDLGYTKDEVVEHLQSRCQELGIPWNMLEGRFMEVADRIYAMKSRPVNKEQVNDLLTGMILRVTELSVSGVSREQAYEFVANINTMALKSNPANKDISEELFNKKLGALNSLGDTAIDYVYGKEKKVVELN